MAGIFVSSIPDRLKEISPELALTYTLSPVITGNLKVSKEGAPEGLRI